MKTTHILSRAFALEANPPQSGETSPEQMEAINCLAQRPLTADEVYVRNMYLCSSQLCEQDGCRFSDQALEQISRLVVGESVLAGHDKSTLPVARFFAAEVVPRPELPDPETGTPSQWVQASFYWLAGTRGAADLALNIDGGIYREVSLSWRYRGGRCSICNQTRPACGHLSGERYGEQVCYTWIDDVLEVLEGSLVYRGADRHTGLSRSVDAAAETLAPTAFEQFLLFELGPEAATR